ncbi:hypothetical protein P170DRAFT_438443 [Aspergillus steynii IBT 23096]|uniref:Uncharacterized protein n=1 Tax=Aspergillus steynii IBT 23096 TaxID=1392250 RepID=A0A2I2G1J1_9EURO|nr:uncharacterized protein P170DRAFT_438443 [Aspergillus steynii IBT 23096]PLB46742.1 hypothetical protein P170DRAFT_438443 [Aspergillus steynii IBT 23096]
MDPSSTYHQETTSTDSIMTAYSPNFIKHLVANGIYPAGYKPPDGQQLPKPINLAMLIKILSQERPSSPPVSEGKYAEFMAATTECDLDENVTELTRKITRLIEGTDGADSVCTRGFVFTNFADLTDGTIGKAKPGSVAGARAEQLDSEIRAFLNKYVEPSTCHNLIVPNFFFDAKGPSTSPTSFLGRACYGGALGARGIHALQSLGQGEPAFDGNAYTISATFGRRVLTLYAHHPIKSAGDGRTEYVMTEICSYDLLFGLESYERGVAAYQNARDWAKQMRDGLIIAANQRKANIPNLLTSASSVAKEEDATSDLGINKAQWEAIQARLPWRL